MKKFFSFFAAMLFAGSMMAVENEDIVFKTDAGFGAITITTAGLTGTGADYEFSQGDITVTGTLGYIYNKKHSVYKNGTMIVSAGTNIIDSIQIEYNSTCYPFVELSEGVNLIPEGQKNAGKTNGIQMKTFINVAGGSSCTFTNASAGKTEIREMNVFYHASAGLPEGPAIDVNVEAGMFSITPANDELIYMFMLLTEEAEGGVSEENARALAEVIVGYVSADYTLAEFVEYGEAYQGAFEDVEFEAVKEGGLVDGTYALVAFVVAENDPVAHTAEIASQITYVEFTVGPTTGLKQTESVKVGKSLKNGQLVIEKNGVRFNVLGAKL